MKRIQFSQLFATGVICLLLMIPTDSFAAQNPDFTGKWKFNESESTMGEGRFFAAGEMTVKQKGNTINIERTYRGRGGQQRTMSETLTMDGEKNVIERRYGVSTIIATWSDDNNSLTIETGTEFNRQGETFTMSRKEVWTLEEGGEVLNIQSTSSSQRGTRTASLIYDKI